MGRYVEKHKRYYILKYPNGDFARMNKGSEGLPFPTKYLNEINYWGLDQLEEMKNYMKLFPGLIPYEVILSIAEYPLINRG